MRWVSSLVTALATLDPLAPCRRRRVDKHLAQATTVRGRCARGAGASGPHGAQKARLGWRATEDPSPGPSVRQTRDPGWSSVRNQRPHSECWVGPMQERVVPAPNTPTSQEKREQQVSGQAAPSARAGAAGGHGCRARPAAARSSRAPLPRAPRERLQRIRTSRRRQEAPIPEPSRSGDDERSAAMPATSTSVLPVSPVAAARMAVAASSSP
jgi:hypothetical protein